MRTRVIEEKQTKNLMQDKTEGFGQYTILLFASQSLVSAMLIS